LSNVARRIKKPGEVNTDESRCRALAMEIQDDRGKAVGRDVVAPNQYTPAAIQPPRDGDGV